jgi:HEPN domain-containing protein
MTVDEETFINFYATQCLRDVADKDYILARVAFEMKFYQQFQWLGMQCIEKYMKSILLFNRKDARKIRHNLLTGYDAIKEIPFINLGENTVDTIKHFDTYGDNRYLNRPYHIFGNRLPQLDFAVWEIRRYCQVLNIDFISYRSQKTEDYIKERLMEINTLINKFSKNLIATPKEAYIDGGLLEKILLDRKHPSRKDLVYNNGFFLKKYRKNISVKNDIHAENSPLSIFPEHINTISEYIYMPSSEKKAFQELSENKKKEALASNKNTDHS